MLGGQTPMWRELIDQIGEILAEASEELFGRHPGVLSQRVESVAAQRLLELIRRDLLVGARAHPGMGDLPMAALLQNP